MNSLTKLLLIALLIIIVIQLLSYFYKRSKRIYSDRLQIQLKDLYAQLQEHVNTTDLIVGVEPGNAQGSEASEVTQTSSPLPLQLSTLAYPQLIVAFQQICYAATQCDVLLFLAPSEDLEKLIASNLDAERQHIQLLQKAIAKEMRERSTI